MRVGITGSAGLLGWHLSCFFKTLPDVELSLATRETFANQEILGSFVHGCDVVIHLAGMNRGDDKVVAETNLMLARKLVEACQATQARPHLVFSSSTHIHKGTPYGDSKRACSDLFSQWAVNAGAKFTNLILPHVFGEGGRPHYNSAISTFGYQLARGELPQVHVDSQLELFHCHQVAELVCRCIAEGRTGDVAVEGHQIQVSDALRMMQEFDRLYRALIVPNVSCDFDLYLFNTYRSYLYPEYFPVTLTLRTDSRGSLFEVEKNRNGGQTFLSTTHPGITRGNHFHFRKIERFCVVQGEAVIRIRRVFDPEVREYRVSGDRPQYIDMPTLHTHSITNCGSSELLTIFWSHDIFDPKRTETYAEKV